ncbi:DUF4097 family beta strand repeat-containing protein [Streptomyces cinnamoneus]|uniref:DUF4097 family beta strand repeat-containing protein n=1 Tax=Streptomyces cinnamoneus TaxID=53446 RepID=UPI0033E8285E
MSTEQTFTATAAGQIWADIAVDSGIVTVTVEPGLKAARITVRTPTDEGPVADAVRNTTSYEHVSNGRNVLTVCVPKVQGGTCTTVQFGAGSFSSMVFTAGTGTVVSGGDVYVGGQQIVSNGRVVAEAGTVVSGPGAAGQITVDVRLPELSSVRLETTSADLRVLQGDLQVLDVCSLSGDVEARGVHTFRGKTTSGDFEVGSVAAKVDVSSVSGDVEVEAYGGSDFRVNTVSGDVSVSATPAASGSIDVTSVSGDITSRGAGHLAHRTRTVSGRVRPRQ